VRVLTDSNFIVLDLSGFEQYIKKKTTKLATTITTCVKTIQCEKYEKSYGIVSLYRDIPLDPLHF